MADNVEITAGTGTPVTTDQAADGSHMQLVKLAYSANADKTPIGADANGLDVDVTRLPGTVTEDGASAGGESLLLLGAVRNDAAASKTSNDGDYSAVAVDAAGRVGIADLGGSISVDDNGSTLSVDDGGSSLTVDGTVTANLAAGTNNIGDVDVLTVPAPLSTTGGGTEAAALRVTIATDSTGVLSIDDNGSTVSIDDGGGNISIDDGGNSITVDNGGTFAVQVSSIAAGNNNIGDVDVASLPAPFGAAGATSVAKAEDVASADADVGIPAMAVRKATPANTSGTDGDYEMLQMSAGRLWTSATIDAALPAGTNAIGKLAANSGVDIGDVDVTSLTGGTIAHDSVDSGNPIKVGGRAAATLSDDTMVANADRTDLVTDLDAALIVRPGVPLGDRISERVTDTGGTSTVFSNFGATANARNHVDVIVVYNSSATAGTVDFRDGTGGSVLWTMPIPAGGGSIIAMPGQSIFKTTANTALAYDVSGALTTVTISIGGFKSKVV